MPVAVTELELVAERETGSERSVAILDIGHYFVLQQFEDQVVFLAVHAEEQTRAVARTDLH